MRKGREHVRSERSHYRAEQSQCENVQRADLSSLSTAELLVQRFIINQ